MRAGRRTNRSLNDRTVAEIQRKVVKQGKRNKFSRFVLAKGDEDKIVAWKQVLIRFSMSSTFVHSALLSIRELNSPFRTELVIMITPST